MNLGRARSLTKIRNYYVMWSPGPRTQLHRQIEELQQERRRKEGHGRRVGQTITDLTKTPDSPEICGDATRRGITGVRLEYLSSLPRKEARETLLTMSRGRLPAQSRLLNAFVTHFRLRHSLGH